MIKTSTIKIDNILLILLYLIISIIIITILINKNLHCDFESDTVMKSISYYDIHHLPIRYLGDG